MSKRGGTWLPFVFFLRLRPRGVYMRGRVAARPRGVYTRGLDVCVCVCAQNLDDRT